MLFKVPFTFSHTHFAECPCPPTNNIDAVWRIITKVNSVLRRDVVLLPTSWRRDVVWLQRCILARRSTSLISSDSPRCRLKVVRYRSSNCWMISTVRSTTPSNVTTSTRYYNVSLYFTPVNDDYVFNWKVPFYFLRYHADMLRLCTFFCGILCRYINVLLYRIIL